MTKNSKNELAELIERLRRDAYKTDSKTQGDYSAHPMRRQHGGHRVEHGDKSALSPST